MIALAVKLFPDPDSPTRPIASWCPRWNEIPRMISSVRPLMAKPTRSCSTSSRCRFIVSYDDAPGLTARVKKVAQCIAKQIDADDADRDGEPRKERQPPFAGKDIIERIGQHGPPTRGGW